MDDKKLLEALKDASILSEEEIGGLLTQARNLDRPVEDVLYDRRLASEEDVVKVKSKILKVPYKEVDIEALDPEVLKMIPPETARKYRLIPLSRDKNLLVIGMVAPDDLAAQEALRFLAKEQKVSLGVYLIAPSVVEDTLRKYGSYLSDIQTAVESLNVKPGEGSSELQRIVRLEEGMGADANEAPIIRIVSSMLKEAVNVNSSDIHIEPERSKLRIRFRLDGALQEFMTFPPELHQQVVSRIKVLSSLKLDETRIPQDGRFRTRVFDREIDFRVATFPTPAGEKVAIRVLDPKTGLKSLDELGVVGRNLELIEKGIARPYGMILMTGPTGSGKTTTLYALMQILNKESVNVVSLEDPVEYTIDGINQSQVRPEIGYTFASGLRQILRQDPDIIMVGEIRDGETADLAVHAALTGHIVLSTLHTNNSIGVIPRLANMGVQPFLLPSVLNLMASQRLVSRLCQKCKKAEAPSAPIAEAIRKAVARLPQDLAVKYKEPFKIWHSPGCMNCRKKGTDGRIALFEMFEMTPQLADIIVGRAINENELLAEAKRQKTIFLREDGVMKALEGLVSIEEVLKETEEI